MIFAVDDEPSHLELMTAVLSAEGYEVETFSSAVDALFAAESVVPQLIISDIEMPEMDGFQFHRDYVAKYTYRHTPFVFLSSHSEPEMIIKGLDSGADDYLQKPLLPEILRAKVRSILNRKQRYVAQSFCGDLGKLSFSGVMHFCELKNLTGWVEISAENYEARFRFDGGELLLNETEDEIDKVFDLEEGHFTICVESVDYQDIINSAVVTPTQNPSSSRTEPEKPMGKLSGVRVQKRLFQIQTEFSDNQIVTVVILDGRVMHKKSQQVEATADKSVLETIIEKQHLMVEKEIYEKLDELVDKQESQGTNSVKKFNQLYDEGFDKYRAGEVQAALELWEKAHEINPDDKALVINLSVLRKKLAGGLRT